MSSERNSFLQSDKNLYLRLKKFKDRQAFLQAYDLYVAEIYRFVYFKLNSREEAEDLTSAVFVKCWSYVVEGKLNASNGYKSLKSFLYTIARNAVIDYYRQQKNTESLAAVEHKLATPDQQPALEAKLDLSILQNKLNQLKSDYRGIIIMRYVNQLSVAEIADILGKSKANVRVTLHRALSALRELINQDEQ